MELTKRHKQIIAIVKAQQPVSGDQIAEQLGLTKSTLRSDLAVLTMIGTLAARPKVGYIYRGEVFEQVVSDELKNMTVKNAMESAIIIHQDDTIDDAITALFMQDVDTLFVNDNTDKLVGVVSRKDLLRTLIMGNNHSIAVAVIMTRVPNIHMATPQMSILKAAKLMTERQVDALPVMKSEFSFDVVGKVSKTTLVKILANLDY